MPEALGLDARTKTEKGEEEENKVEGEEEKGEEGKERVKMQRSTHITTFMDSDRSQCSQKMPKKACMLKGISRTLSSLL